MIRGNGIGGGTGLAGYTNGDILTVVGGTFTTPATFQATVVAGAVTALTPVSPGSGYTSAPANPAATSGGTGAGCTINVQYAGNLLDFGQGGTVEAAADTGLLTSRLVMIEGILISAGPAVAGTIAIFRQDGTTSIIAFAVAAAQVPIYWPLEIEVTDGGFAVQINQADMEALVFYRDLTNTSPGA